MKNNRSYFYTSQISKIKEREEEKKPSKKTSTRQRSEQTEVQAVETSTKARKR